MQHSNATGSTLGSVSPALTAQQVTGQAGTRSIDELICVGFYDTSDHLQLNSGGSRWQLRCAAQVQLRMRQIQHCALPKSLPASKERPVLLQREPGWSKTCCQVCLLLCRAPPQAAPTLRNPSSQKSIICERKGRCMICLLYTSDAADD